MEEFLNELLNFIDKKTDWKFNNDTTNSQVITEFLYRNKELTAQFITSVGKPDSDTGGGLHLADVNGSALMKELLNSQQEIISSPIRFNGVSNEDIKRIFAEYGIKYEQLF